MDLLEVRNGRITTTSGQPVLLRGFNIGGWMNFEDFINGTVGSEHSLRATMARILGPNKAGSFFDAMLEHFFTESDVKAMAQLGANVLRIPFNYRHFESDEEPGIYLEGAFQRLQLVLDWCALSGIYAVLDFHAVQGWQNPDWHSDNAHVHILLYQNRHYQERFASLWKEIASRFKSHPALAGYNLMNEPLTRIHLEDYDSPFFDWNALNSVHRMAVEAIRSVDTNHLLFLEGDQFSTEFDGLDTSFDPNIVICSHNYIDPTGGNLPYPGYYDGQYWNRDIIASHFGAHSGTRRAFQDQKPLFIGEFGTWYAGFPESLPDRVRALDDQLSVFNSAGVHWSIWTWKDIASMGIFNLDPDSEYLRIVHPLIEARQRAADWEGEMQSSPVTLALQAAGDAVNQTLAGYGIETRMDRKWFSQYSLFAYTAQFLQVPFAQRFLSYTEKEIERIMQSFRMENCIPNQPVYNTVQKHLTAPGPDPASPAA